MFKESESSSGSWKPSSLERLACAALEALELGAGAPASSGAAAGAEAGAEAARKLLCAPASAHLHARAQCLLRAVHQSQYHQFKVRDRNVTFIFYFIFFLQLLGIHLVTQLHKRFVM